MQHMTKINNLSAAIHPMESIPCPDCGNRVTMDRSQNYALHFICITLHLHLKIMPCQHEMHDTSRFKCHALRLFSHPVEFGF